MMIYYYTLQKRSLLAPLNSVESQNGILGIETNQSLNSQHNGKDLLITKSIYTVLSF